MKYITQFFVAASLLFTALSLPAHADDKSALAKLKSGNHFAIMRHALAPGTGDPSNFDLNNCSTQRNLSQGGIDQAKNIGQRFRDSGITSANVYTSQWCRCVDTAVHLKLGNHIELPIINSFFQNFNTESAQTTQLRTWLAKQDLTKPTILVTHQVNITSLTGVYPSSGEVIIIKRAPDGTLTVSDRVKTN
ncbi:histidine phosphatase family protein [Leucothrix sargassi]|nr:histidine phosphatase family protein [Leucothrix sargassi]